MDSITGMLLLFAFVIAHAIYLSRKQIHMSSLSACGRLVGKKCIIYCVEMHDDIFYRVYFKCKYFNYTLDIQTENISYIEKCILRSKSFILKSNSVHGIGIVENKEDKITERLVEIVDSKNLNS